MTIVVQNNETGAYGDFLQRAIWRKKFVLRVRVDGKVRHWLPESCTVNVNGAPFAGKTFYDNGRC